MAEIKAQETSSQLASLQAQIASLTARLNAAGAPEPEPAPDTTPTKVTLLKTIGRADAGLGKTNPHTAGATVVLPAHHAKALVTHGLATLAAALMLLAGVFCATPAQAVTTTTFVGDFQVTNLLVSGVAIVGWPTNSVTTNLSAGSPIGYGVGSSVDVGNVEELALDFTCYPMVANASNTNSDTVTFQLIRANCANPPVSAFQYWNNTGYITNNIGTTNSVFYNPFETALPANLSFTISGIAATANTNAFHWHTNLTLLLGQEQCQWIGVYSITNASTNAVSGYTVLTNVDLQISGKIRPWRFP